MPLGKNEYFYPVVQKPQLHYPTTTLIVSGSVYTTGEQIEKRDAVYINSDGKIYKTNPFSVSSSMFTGFCENDIESGIDVFVFSTTGQIINGFNGLSIGLRYFISFPNGKISITPPTQKGTTVYQVGISKSNTEILIFPQFFIIN